MRVPLVLCTESSSRFFNFVYGNRSKLLVVFLLTQREIYWELTITVKIDPLVVTKKEKWDKIFKFLTPVKILNRAIQLLNVAFSWMLVIVIVDPLMLITVLILDPKIIWLRQCCQKSIECIDKSETLDVPIGQIVKYSGCFSPGVRWFLSVNKIFQR